MSGPCRGPSWREGWGRGSVREESGGVLRRAGLTAEVLPLSFFRVVELGPSSGLVLVAFDVLETDDEDSFFLVSTPSPTFFFTFSPFAFAPSVFPLTLTF